ncbi:MAG TPA: carboxypeptidase-like regulatory domain-containing protein, partial [Chitinophagaceae bacterium]
MKQKLLLGLLMFFALSSIAQQRTVTGVITDDKGVPLSGVSVTIKGTTTGTTTAADGTFSLSVPTAGRLIVSSVGYSTTEINVGTKNALDIILTSENQVLTDVVVVGYGTARKKDLTGSVASVKAKDFNKGVINSPDQLLQNKVAGLEVTNIS